MRNKNNDVDHYIGVIYLFLFIWKIYSFIYNTKTLEKKESGYTIRTERRQRSALTGALSENDNLYLLFSLTFRLSVTFVWRRGGGMVPRISAGP